MNKLKKAMRFLFRTTLVTLIFMIAMITATITQNMTPASQVASVTTITTTNTSLSNNEIMKLFNSTITVHAAELQNSIHIRHRTVFSGRILARGGLWSELEIFEGADGRLYKCVDPFVAPGVGTFTKEAIPNTYTFETINRTITFTPELKDKLALINYFGDQETPGLDRSIYTNLMIWDILLPDYYGEHTRFEGAPSHISKTAYNNFKSEVNEKIRRYNLLPSFDNTTVTLKAGESKIIEDTNSVLDTLKFENKNGFTFERLDNRRLKVTATAGASTVQLRFKKNIDPNKQYSSVFYHKPGSQKMGLFGIADPLDATVAFNVQKDATVKIVKTDELGNKVPNVTFEISREKDFNNNPFTATTNAQGEIVDAGWALTPTDKVYVREKTVPNHLVKSDEIKEVQLVAGQTATVSFVNKIKKGNIEVLKVAKHDNNVKVEGAVFELRKGTQLISTSTTNKYGVARFENVSYGAYTLVETKAPEGYFAPTFTKEVIISEHNKTITFTVENEKKPTIQTEAHANNEKITEATGTITLKDKVMYKDLIISKEYEAILIWMNKKTNSPLLVNGQPLTVTKTFIPTEANGFVELSVDVDASVFTEDTTIVAFESLQKEGIEVATHADINDVDQTVEIIRPSIKTTATGANGEKEVRPEEKVTLKDRVDFNNLIVGKEYVATLTWMNKKMNSPLLVDGNPVTATKTFIPAESKGFVELEVEINATALAGTELVAFEKITRNGIEVATHADIEDKGQTVRVKELGKVTVHKVDATTKQKIERFVKFGLFKDGALIEEKSSDKGFVVFENLVEGDQYEVKELEAPIGYIKSEEVLKVTITKENTELSFEYENELLPIVKITPPTNDATNNVLFGLLSMISILGFVVLRRKQD